MAVVPVLVGGAGDSTPGNPQTFSAVNFGATAPDRILTAVFGYDADGNGSLTGVTIGGISAARAIVAALSDMTADIWYATVPAGTNGNITTVNAGGDYGNMAFSLFRHTASAATPSDTDSTTGAGASVTLPNLTVPTDGAAIFGYYNDDTATVSWSGATEAQETVVGSDIFSSASTLAVGTNPIVATGAVDNQALVGVAWAFAPVISPFKISPLGQQTHVVGQTRYKGY